MKAITWHKVGTNGNGNGLYQSVDRKFRIVMFNNMTGRWHLLQLADTEFSDYDWCQSFALLRDAKQGAALIQQRHQVGMDAMQCSGTRL